MQVTQEILDYAEKTINEGTDEQKLAFFSFEKTDNPDIVIFKFQYWV